MWGQGLSAVQTPMMPFVFLIALFYTGNASYASFTDTRPRDSHGWVPCNTTGRFAPLSDAQAAALVIGMTENRPSNLSANHYRPSSTELAAFHNNETDKKGLRPAQFNPYTAYVTGGFTGTTDEIIQWGAAKWGIPPDWLRAEYIQESRWNMSQLGDLTTVSDVTKYPAYSRYSSTQVYQSLGISQVKWNHPDANNAGIGTEPLRWKSTAFNVDYELSMVRFYFDNPKGARSSWGDAYSSCNDWLSLAAWFQPYPWNNSGQQTYATKIQTLLASKTWQLSSFPPAIPSD
jgi:hypothetical protein